MLSSSVLIPPTDGEPLLEPRPVYGHRVSPPSVQYAGPGAIEAHTLNEAAYWSVTVR